MTPEHQHYAELAALAYTAPPTVQRGDLRAVRTVENGMAIWAFPGTVLKDPRNVIRDACALPVHDPLLGWVHAGFHAGGELLGLDVAFGTGENQPFMLVGHSLGGALAQEIGASFAARGRPPREIVCFNSPRVGSRRFCKALAGVDLTLYRWGNDKVSLVPWMLGLYRNRVPWSQEGTPHDGIDGWLNDHAMKNFLAPVAGQAPAVPAVPPLRPGPRMVQPPALR